MTVGSKAPDFTLPDQDGNPFNLYGNLDAKILLVFYPKDESMVCTKQLCDYNSNYDEFIKAGFKIIGISHDDEQSHKAFAEKFFFRFRLLSDPDKTVSRMYDAVGIRGTPKRKIIALDENGTIMYIDTRFPAFYRDSSFLLNLFKDAERLDN